jgi:DNA-binding HxlR family transcriptional regulator
MMAVDQVAEDGRLLVLKELAKQTDGRSNDVVLGRVLDAFGYRRSRDWLRTQLRRLEELGAVRIDAVDTVMVATLRKAGRDHVERRAVIEGVSRPADED